MSLIFIALYQWEVNVIPEFSKGEFQGLFKIGNYWIYVK